MTAKRVRETPEVAAGAARMVKAVATRAGSGDVEALPLLADLGDLVEVQLCAAVQGCIAVGYSWADVGRVLGMTKQAAHQRFSGTARRAGAVGGFAVKGQLTLEATG